MFKMSKNIFYPIIALSTFFGSCKNDQESQLEIETSRFTTEVSAATQGFKALVKYKNNDSLTKLLNNSQFILQEDLILKHPNNNYQRQIGAFLDSKQDTIAKTYSSIFDNKRLDTIYLSRQDILIAYSDSGYSESNKHAFVISCKNASEKTKYKNFIVE